MECLICGSKDVEVTYEGRIRNGAPGNETETAIKVYKCDNCKCIWHNPITEKDYYDSNEYRESMNEKVSLGAFNSRHDSEILDKLNYTGTAIFRDKVYMDVGCGGGGLADYINGVAKKTILVEPNELFAELLRAKEYEVYSCMKSFTKKDKLPGGGIDVLTSFDVIEHVEDPQGFVNDVVSLLSPGGKAFIGTPTEYPILRTLLGPEFDRFLFSVQHPWVFSGATLLYMAEKSGFDGTAHIEYRQLYGMGNLLSWLKSRGPKGDITFPFISQSLDAVYKSEMANEATADYIVMVLDK
jgi:2-polyprenyl-3-methyl-5-hydroxy-6-metoxy-1,4-benzoquinol methylase